MRIHYCIKAFLLLFVSASILSCSSSDDAKEQYEELSPVVMDLTSVPYPRLSNYKFFEGELKELDPALGVVPYDLNSSLFTDYAKKKRFVWMPHGTKATYSSDGEMLNFPTGAALIKNFYYDNVQPGNLTKIIETRVMIKKAEGWIFANYIWNDEQTEAVYDAEGGDVPVSWQQGDEVLTINYKIPKVDNCSSCHGLNNSYVPIGPKPQNLNKIYNYSSGAANQLVYWKEQGYLDAVPQNITSSVNWEDESQPLELRARSYLDINCAHCHTAGGGCDYTPMDLAFNKTDNPVNLGICVEPVDFVTGNQRYIIERQDPRMSLLYFRMETTIPVEMMPLTGRTVTHTEGLKLMEDWINSLEGQCP